MRRTISRLLAVAILSASAYAQVPVVGSSGSFQYVFVSGLPGLPLAQQGLYLGWNHAGLGESDFFTHPGTGVGGFNWYNGASATLVMHLDGTTGVLTNTNGFAGPVAGNVVGNLTGNSNGTHTGPVVGNASSATTATTASALASTSPCGSGFATGISTAGAGTGCGTNIATANALAASPGNCATGHYTSGINASGTAQNCSPLWLMATGTGCTTAATGASSCTATINWDSPGFSGAPSRFLCGGISPTGFPQGPYVNAVTGSTISVQISNGQSGEAVASGFATVTCWGQQ